VRSYIHPEPISSTRRGFGYLYLHGMYRNIFDSRSSFIFWFSDSLSQLWLLVSQYGTLQLVYRFLNHETTHILLLYRGVLLNMIRRAKRKKKQIHRFMIISFAINKKYESYNLSSAAWKAIGCRYTIFGANQTQAKVQPWSSTKLDEKCVFQDPIRGATYKHKRKNIRHGWKEDETKTNSFFIIFEAICCDFDSSNPT